MLRKAVIPAAGLGTRFLPATKAQPKEMLPIIDTPVIQYVVQEAIDSGITDILIISGKGKRAVEDHFDRNWELETILKEKEDASWYQMLKAIGEMADIHYIRQKETKGLGDAILHAKRHVGDEPFAVLLGDTVVDSTIPVTRQLIDIYDQYESSVVSVEQVPQDKVTRYGIIGGEDLSERLKKVNVMVEKPETDEAPSNLAFAGRYILTPEIFSALEQTSPGKHNELQLTDAMQILLQRESIFALQAVGKRHDIGNKMDYLKTIVEFGLNRPEFEDEFRRFLKEIVK